MEGLFYVERGDYMLVPFRKETLSQQSFLREEVRFDLLNTICEGELAASLQTGDGGAVVLGNPGRNIWLWVDGDRGSAYASEAIGELAERLKGAALPGVVAAPESAKIFCEVYCRKSGASAKLNFSLMSYFCPAVKTPQGVPGRMETAGKEHAETVADFICCFNRDCFHTEGEREQAFASAQDMIGAGKLMLWQANGKTVCMAAAIRRSARHVRIGFVYTPPEERSKGYASALVATVSQGILDEGLMPVLYADLANPASNKAYRNIGYIPAGQVDEYSFQYR